MNGDKFVQQIAAMHRHIATLQQRLDRLPWEYGQPADTRLLAAEAFEEFRATLEELQVAEEELRQQNQELAATHQMLEAERQRYQDLFEFAPDGYLVTDVKGIIREANRAVAVLLNLSQQSLVGKPLLNFVPQSERRAFGSQLTQLTKQDSPQEWEVQLQPRQESRQRQQSFDAALTVAVVRDGEKPITLRWMLRDITARKRAEAVLLRTKLAEAAKQELEKETIQRQRIESELRKQALHDALTGLPNRALFMDRLEHAIAYGKRHEDYLFAVLFLDLDRFKLINDSLGHTWGDKLLITVAGKLQACLRPTDTVARLGADEFTILLEGVEDGSDVIRVAERLQAELALPLNLGGQEVLTTASIGIALSVTGYDQPADLLRDADIAMYQAKARGPARYEIFNTDLHARAVGRLQVETELRWAIERQEFRVHYQPVVSLTTGRITGFEALVRWQHPDRGLIFPGEFIPVAEESGLILLIDQWVLREACRQTQQWQEQFPQNPPLTINVNLCTQQFLHPDLIQQINQTLQKTGLDARNLKLEITENVIMKDTQPTTTLAQLRALDVKLCIDDFGTGYSSLSRLHCLPIHTLKIDRSFVSRMDVDQRSPQASTPIVAAIATLAQALGLAVIAEGVETAEQLEQLRGLKCDYGQGYFFSRPLDAEAAAALIATKSQW